MQKYNIRKLRQPLIGFVVGKYFELGSDGKPDYNGIDRNITEASRYAYELAKKGFLAFTPHLNTFHFEMRTKIDDDPLQNEEFYRAFDRKLLAEGVDYIFATPNWRESSGGRLEIQLACSLGIPVFESIKDLTLWASGRDDFSHVIYNSVSEEALNFGSRDIPVIMILGPHIAKNNHGNLDLITTINNEIFAERTAIELFNQKIATFTPQMNWSVRRLGISQCAYEPVIDALIERAMDAIFLLPEWNSAEQCAEILTRNRCTRPMFTSLTDLTKWRDNRLQHEEK